MAASGLETLKPMHIQSCSSKASTVFITESNQNPESNSPEAEAALAATSPTSPTAADEMRVSAALQSQGGMSIMSQSYDDDFEDEEDTTAS